MCTPTRNSGYCQVAAYNSTQHTAISDMCVYMFLFARARVARLYVCSGLCVRAVCSVNVWSVAQSSVRLRPE